MFARGGKFIPKALSVAGLAGVGTLAVQHYNESRRQQILRNEVPQVSIVQKPNVTLPTREELLSKLQKTDQFDLLVIGGGASGTGCALDAATRGLNVACVEANDFASGTSSKSTKMAHGGVRYLEKAFFELSKAQLDLVIEALNERGHMLESAPHLCKVLPIMIPVYSYWQVPYFYAGCKMYDWFAGKQNLRSSYLLSKSSAAELAPMLDESKLKAGLVYHDGSFNDSRMNSTLALTAIEHGATVLNYMKVKQLIKDPATEKILGAVVENRETGEEISVKSKVVVNATGPYSDLILQMDRNKDGFPDPAPPQPDHVSIANEVAVNKPEMVVPSAGVHIILPSYYCPKTVGLLDVKTADGRVMFFLPWQGKVLAGTTDIPMKTVPQNPTASESDIQDILRELQHYIKFPVRREDVLSAWAGIRPLVMDPRKRKEKNGGGTEDLVRNHLIFTSDNGLITLAGGKWTTYREMAEQTIDTVVKQGGFHVKPCITKKLKLVGGENWDPNLSALLAQRYGLSEAMAIHLSNNYGTRAPLICELFEQDERNQLPVALGGKENVTVLHHVNFDSFRYPFTIGELLYSIHNEYARKATDFLMRRTRYAYLDAANSLSAVEGTVKVMGDELNWDAAKRQQEIEECTEFIKTFGV
ncbi:ZYBA0S16-00408g1_1 [Zygosaccharomyces bailii CLIB 213]|uniref:Glycerol-3-phosphate dehydrogenase n=1 Tax=Zygosaccharomyces bailii (strain CLIB 213 / ATCC 58445 / CBS 680 / BCRC 21525 / NBRC 1098 / NCYC 1416 / NRRL Y-2227) TaxID=1333698 RepID=A0A8J2X5H5_ZYGB2|nr:ZYBA0S16-00408g1_1 [Zygosaccharomyces bailii CLIB 213]